MAHVNQAPPRFGISRGEQPGQRHVLEQGIGVVGVAVRQRELHRLDGHVDRVGRVVPHRLEVEPGQQLQRLQQERPLGPRAALVQGVSAVHRGNRLLHAGDVPCEVAGAEQPAPGKRPVADLPRQRAAVEIVSHQPQPAAPVAARALLGLDQTPHGASEVFVPSLFVPVQQAEQRRRGPGKGESAVAVEGRQAGVEQRGHGGRLETLAGDAAAGLEEFAGRQSGCNTLPRQDLDGAGLPVVDHDRDFTPEADGGGIGDGQGENRGDRRVDGVAAALQGLQPRLDRLRSPGRDRAVLTRCLPRSGTARWRLGRRQR